MNTPSTSIVQSITQQTLLLPGRVIPFGYACDSSMTKLIRLMREEKAYIVDIRLAPQSRWHRAFNKAALAKRFPKRYMHMPELGNLHYRPEDREKGIKLANPEQGIARLIKGLEKGYTLILLCACKNKGCHRWEVITLLADAVPNEMPVEHLVEVE